MQIRQSSQEKNMKGVILISGLAGLVIFGPPVLRSRIHHHDVSVIVHEVSHARDSEARHDQGSHDSQDQCRFEAERTLDLSAGGVEALHLEAGSGSLEIVGVEGANAIVAVGRACASHEEFLDDLQLTSEMAGGTVLMETQHPDWSGWSGGNRYARIDLRVEIPADMSAEVKDGSGEMVISNTGSLSIEDGSGEVVLSDIHGDLTVQDGSGELVISGVTGFVTIEDGSGEIVMEGMGADVEIDDSSGEMTIVGVNGSLTVQDSSGEMDIQDVAGFVRIVQDGGGDIQVRRIGGDFIVERDGSGDIEHSDVSGTVTIPKKKGRN
jgi:hypothetical protein